MTSQPGKELTISAIFKGKFQEGFPGLISVQSPLCNMNSFLPVINKYQESEYTNTSHSRRFWNLRQNMIIFSWAAHIPSIRFDEQLY